MVSRCTAAYFIFCFLVVVLALWSCSSVAAYFAFCFLLVCVVKMFGGASGDTSEISWKSNWFKSVSTDLPKAMVLYVEFVVFVVVVVVVFRFVVVSFLGASGTSWTSSFISVFCCI